MLCYSVIIELGGIVLKKVIGIISCVLFLLISLQSCVAGIGNTLSENGEIGGTGGLMLAFFMLVAGIIVILSKQSKGLTITAIVFYVLGGLIGIMSAGSYADLQVWSILSFIFAGLTLFHLIKYKDTYIEVD